MKAKISQKKCASSSSPRRVCSVNFLFAMSVGLLGCGGDMSVGEQNSSSSNCLSPALCPPPTIDLPDDYVGVAARATSALTPVWSKPLSPNTFGTRASDGNVWLASAEGEAISVRRIDDQGVSSQETKVAVPVTRPNTVVSPYIHRLSPHAKGPVISTFWSYLAAEGVDCTGRPRPAGTPTPTCPWQENEVIVLDGANLGSPTRLDPCADVAGDCRGGGDVHRSGDGQSLLLALDSTLVEETLDGQVLSQSEIPSEFHALTGTSVGEHGFTLYGTGGGLIGGLGGLRGLITFERGGKPGVTTLSGVDVSTPFTGNGLVLPGPGPGQTIVVAERRAASSANGGGSALPGDIAVLRLEAGVLTSQQVLTRQEYANLPLAAATADDAGNVYILTSTGDRDATLNHSLTTLVCRFPIAAAAACFQLPAPELHGFQGQGIYALRENVLISTTSTELTRFDLPL